MKIAMRAGYLAMLLLGGCDDDDSDEGNGADGGDAGGQADGQSDGETDVGANADASNDLIDVQADGATAVCETDLVGIWGVTDIEQAPGSVDSSNSTWTMESDGTYTWCLDLASYQFDGGGNWEKNGAVLTVDGLLVELFAASDVTLLDCGPDTFKVPDDEGALWTYVRDPSATGCAPPD